LTDTKFLHIESFLGKFSWSYIELIHIKIKFA